MKMEDCPVCGKSDAITGADPHERDAVKFDCQRACGMFVMGGWFLKNGWPNVPLEDKAAIAAHLKNREKPVDLSVVISEENYKYYVREGKRLLRLATSPQVSP